ncbi:two-component system response regulator (stage 0 sporulation protein F) [Lysinibacillus composti]|uniref:Response regulator n=1 Tax=Lysinibacillus composti TaxID=720633 RepID=A0A3N9UHQ6_9BACI|nr:response regulator [Lysinibacillus composti]MBM7609007.1 two-component system response regulator (stage 0 sporulation protein F) [Lysinibacillus composti]RQW75571.1 response regulator [Lysinibacillus composti]
MKKILIVDDQKGIQLLLQEVFKKEGYKTLLASTGVEAIRLLEADRVGCVLLDMKIPGMNGIEILKRMKDMNIHLPIFMMTAFGDEELMNQAYELGVSKFFTKPFNIFDVRDEVKAAMAE